MTTMSFRTHEHILPPRRIFARRRQRERTRSTLSSVLMMTATVLLAALSL